MCVSYCGSFPELFKRIDRDVDAGAAEGAEKLDDFDVKAVADQCWQCKLCYIKCPYTPDEGAAELLDFPRLMSRERAARAQRERHPPGRPHPRRAADRGPARLGLRGADGQPRGDEPAPPQGAGEGDRHLRRVPAPTDGRAAVLALARQALAGAERRRARRGRALRHLLRRVQHAQRGPRGDAGAGAQRVPGARHPRRRGRARQRGARPGCSPAAGCPTSTAATSRRPPRRSSTTWPGSSPSCARGSRSWSPPPRAG